MHPRIPLAFLAARAHCWLMVNLSSTRTPRSLSTELLSSRIENRTFIQTHHKWIKIGCRISENLRGRSSVHTRTGDIYFILNQCSSTELRASADISQWQHYALDKFNKAFRISHCIFLPDTLTVKQPLYHRTPIWWLELGLQNAL